jgi:hypothetical protein
MIERRPSAQDALVLHVLCGFSVNEIAHAFVSSDAAVEKRISRAKKVLAGSTGLFDLSGGDNFFARLPAVQRSAVLLLLHLRTSEMLLFMSIALNFGVDVRAERVVAQEQASPKHYTENHRKKDWKQAITDAHVSGDCTTQIASQQDRT